MNSSTDSSSMRIATHPTDILIRRAEQGDRHRLTELMHSSSAYRGKYAPILAGYEISKEQVENDLMFVSDQAQGKGVGRRLFDHLRIVARENGVTRIHIVAHPPAEQFYLRMGAFRSGTKEAGGSVSWARPVLSLEIK